MRTRGAACSHDTIRRFRKTIRDFYRIHRREMPWRDIDDPYRVLVSEIMLQQTQVERVMQKYEDFIRAFPSFTSLSRAPLRRVLSLWQGLGYNRRAVALQNISRIVLQDHGGSLPSTIGKLTALPGIGHATACSVRVFAFNRPAVFIETNIRRVFIHHFFHDRQSVTDREIIPLVEKTLPRGNPRQWYYALMDYGAMLGRTGKNPNRKSAHYQRQSPFEGSRRQIRGRILKELLAARSCTAARITRAVHADKDTIQEILDELKREGFVKKRGLAYTVS